MLPTSASYDISHILLLILNALQILAHMGYEKDAGPLPHREAYPVASNDDPRDLIEQHLLPVPSNDPKGNSPLNGG